MAGDTSGARSAYQDFFAIWNDADPEIPILNRDPERQIFTRFLTTPVRTGTAAVLGPETSTN
jgi:hypothetical protein